MLEGIFTLDIGVDLVAGTFVMACLTIYTIYKLIYARCKKNIPPEFEALYSNVFADVLTRYEFHLLIQSKVLKVKEARAIGTQLHLAGNPFKSIIILGNCDATQVSLKFGALADPANVLVKEMMSWSWIGCIEFIEFIEVLQCSGPIYTKLTVIVTHTEVPFNYYQVHIHRLMKLFKDKRSGMSIQNAFLTKMLGYLGNRLYLHDKRYVKAKSLISALGQV
jgi:hypothetical protein